MWLKVLERQPFLPLKWKYGTKHVQLLNLQMVVEVEKEVVVVEEEANER